MVADMEAMGGLNSKGSTSPKLLQALNNQEQRSRLSHLNETTLQGDEPVTW